MIFLACVVIFLTVKDVAAYFVRRRQIGQFAATLTKAQETVGIIRENTALVIRLNARLDTATVGTPVEGHTPSCSRVRGSNVSINVATGCCTECGGHIGFAGLTALGRA